MDDVTVELDDPLSFTDGNGDDDIKVSLKAFISRLTDLLNQVPEDHRDGAILRVRTTGSDYGDYSHVYIEAYYTRPKTATEIAEEQANKRAENERRRLAREAQERAALAILKAKYERS